MDNKWKFKAIRVMRQRVYFFNSEGIYTDVSIIEAMKMKLEELQFDYINRQYYCSDREGAEARAIACLKEGDTIDKLEKDIEKFNEISKLNSKDFKLTNVVYKVYRGKLYYFNDEGVYSCLKTEEILPTDIAIENVKIVRGRSITCCCYNSVRIGSLLGIKSYITFRRAFGKLKLGDTVETLKYYCENDVDSEKSHKPEGLQRFITKIEYPKFVCIPENTDKKGTFDYIYVDINIVTNWEKDRMTYIKENQKKIKQLVFDRIEDTKAFEKYGITTEDLKVKKVTLNNKTSMLYYVLEKKNA